MATYDHDEIVDENKEIWKKRISRSFWAGFVFHMAIVGFIQDSMGKQEYLRRADEDWMNTHWLMWLAIATTAYFIYYKIYGKASR